MVPLKGDSHGAELVLHFFVKVRTQVHHLLTKPLVFLMRLN